MGCSSARTSNALYLLNLGRVPQASFIAPDLHLAPKFPLHSLELLESLSELHHLNQQINQRCKTMVSYGLLVHLGNGVYDMTHEGDQYLTGDLDARELDRE